MATFAELYCAKTGCLPSAFPRRIFWKTLNSHAVPLAPLLMLSDHFASDESMILACGRATSMREISGEIDDFHFHPLNDGWLRSVLRLRVSTRRLRQLAELFLPRSLRSGERDNAAVHPVLAETSIPVRPPQPRPVFRATALRSLPPLPPIARLVRDGFLKPLRPSNPILN